MSNEKKIDQPDESLMTRVRLALDLRDGGAHTPDMFRYIIRELVAQVTLKSNQAQAWVVVAKTLDKCAPDWKCLPAENLMMQACAAVEMLARAAERASAPSVNASPPSVPAGHILCLTCDGKGYQPVVDEPSNYFPVVQFERKKACDTEGGAV